MEGLPLLPGYSFRDPTQTKYHVSHVFEYKNGYAVPKNQPVGIGKKPLDIGSMAFIKQTDPLRYDPSLTYGRTKASVLPTFRPHFLLYDKKCLTFFAFFRQTVNDSPDENYRIRQVNIIYFLEDDSITVMEPVIRDAGFPQGRLIKRSKIPKSDAGDYYHWKDFNVGMDIAMFGTVYHICSCDGYTREYLMSQGVELNEDEELPFDPYIRNRRLSQVPTANKTPSTSEDKLRRFLEYDGKVLRFYIAWDDRESEFGELRPFVMHYYLATDFVDVCEVKQPNSGRDPYPMLINKMKLPKNWKDMPANYPAAYLEKSDHEIVEYYQPKDLIIGNTIFLMARRFIIYDCDQFTRSYYANCLNITQPDPIQLPLFEKKKILPKPQPPPHIGFGSPDDSIQSCYSVVPKPTKKDVLKYIINFGKKLRYTAKLIAVHPEDEGREFIFEYNLADSKILVQELTKQNSGFIGGRFLSPILLPKPGSDISNPDYYTPVDFYIGAIINVYGHKFEITGADLKVYRYMEQNPEKFPTEFINDYRNHFMSLGLLNDDVTKRVELDMRNNDCYEPVNADVNKYNKSVNDNILNTGSS